jgi:hypothetical protein
MTNLLFVSISFPPKNDPECLQTAKYFKYLSKDSAWSISVVTSSLPTLFMPYNKDLERYNSGYNQLIKLPIIETKLSNFALRKIMPYGIDYPDSKYTFHLQKRHVINNLKEKPDIIYSRSNPLSSTLLAYKLKQSYNVPWVMHLSDPWVGSPVHTYKGRHLRFHQQWQDKCFKEAVAICVTSKRTLDFYVDRYPHYSSKFELFPNVYDPDDMINVPLDFNGKLRVIYTGGLAGKRSAQNFILACRQLLQQFPSLENKLEVVFAGPLDIENKLIFERTNLKIINHIGVLSYRKSLELIASAHILLTIDLPIEDPKMAMFFPSKILDYFLAKRRIVALTTPSSSTSDILSKLSATVIPHDDVEEIKKFLIQAIDFFNNRDAAFFSLSHIPEEFSASINGNRLSKLLLSI